MLDTALDLLQFDLHRGGASLGRRNASVPKIAEHIMRHLEHLVAGLHLLEQRFKLRFDIGAADRLAVFGTIAFFVLAQVIGMAGTVAARGPATRQWFVTSTAEDELAQRKIMVQIFTRRNPRRAMDAILNAAIGIKADKRLVAGWNQMQIPIGDRDITRIENPRQNFRDALDGQGAAALLRIVRAGCKIAHEFRLRLETTAGEALKPFLYEGSERFIANHHLPMPFDLIEFIADRRMEQPIAVRRSCLHPVTGLLCVLLALMLIGTGENILLKAPVRVVAELMAGRCHDSACRTDGFAKLIIGDDIAGQPRQVIDDDEMLLFLFLEIEQHLLHGGAFRRLPGEVVMEGLHDIILPVQRMMAAADFL